MSAGTDIPAGLHTRTDFERPSAASIAGAARLGTATLHEAAGKIGALPRDTQCITTGARGWINHPILIGDVTIGAGDLIAGDEDGVVSIPHARVDTVLDASRRRDGEEAAIIQAIEGGASTLDLYGWSRDGDR